MHLSYEQDEQLGGTHIEISEPFITKYIFIKLNWLRLFCIFERNRGLAEFYIFNLFL